MSDGLKQLLWEVNCIVHDKDQKPLLWHLPARECDMWQSKSEHQGAKVKKVSSCRQGEKRQLIFLRSVNKNAFTPSFLSRKEVFSVNVKIFPESGILAIFSLMKLIIYITAIFLKINESPVFLTEPKPYWNSIRLFSIFMSLRFSRTCLIYKHYNF